MLTAERTRPITSLLDTTLTPSPCFDFAAPTEVDVAAISEIEADDVGDGAFGRTIGFRELDDAG